MLFDNLCKATIAGNTRGIYIDPRNCETFIDVTKAINYTSVDFDGVNSVHVYRYDDGQYYIAQAGGYTYDRGLFCDLYDEHGNKYYLDRNNTLIKRS